MKLRAIISPVLIAVAGPGDLYPYDGPVADGPESALQSISVVSR
jgi:hypothetical protein